MSSVLCFDHIDVNYDLTRASHARDDTIAWQTNSKMHMITSHSIETSLHDFWKRLEVCTVDDLRVQERVCDFLK